MTYTYRVISVNTNGSSPASNTVTITVGSPAGPSNPTATATLARPDLPTVLLTWQDNSNSETGFGIQRATDAAFTVGLTTFTVGANVTTYIDGAVNLSTGYYYRVQSFNSLGDAAWATAANVTTPGLVPLAPSGLQIHKTARTSLQLSWTNNAANAKGFYIFRSTAGAGGPYAQVGKAGAGAKGTTRYFSSVRLQLNTTYWFQVQAYNAAGTSTKSDWVEGTTLP